MKECCSNMSRGIPQSANSGRLLRMKQEMLTLGNKIRDGTANSVERATYNILVTNYRKLLVPIKGE